MKLTFFMLKCMPYANVYAWKNYYKWRSNYEYYFTSKTEN